MVFLTSNSNIYAAWLKSQLNSSRNADRVEIESTCLDISISFSSNTMKLIAANEVTSSRLAGLFSQAYSGYVFGPVKLGPGCFDARCCHNLVSLPRSIVAADPEPVTFIMLSRREDKPTETHVAAIGVVPGFRRNSNALRMLTVVAKNERTHGVQTIDLDTRT